LSVDRTSGVSAENYSHELGEIAEMEATPCLKNHNQFNRAQDWVRFYASDFPADDTKQSNPGTESRFAQALRPASPRAWLDRPDRIPSLSNEASDIQHHKRIKLMPEAIQNGELNAVNRPNAVKLEFMSKDDSEAPSRKPDSVHKHGNQSALDQYEGRYESRLRIDQRKEPALETPSNERVFKLHNLIDSRIASQRRNTQEYPRVAEPVDVSQWRQKLRPVDPKLPRETYGMSSRKRDLKDAPGNLPRTPQTQTDEKSGCNFCDPSQSAASSSHHDPPPCLIVEDLEATKYDHLFLSPENLNHGHSWGQSEREEPILSPSRLKLRDLEYGLARKSADDPSFCEVRDEAPKNKTHESFWQTAELSLNPPTNLELRNPEPLLPLDHACEWRARCMDLSSEVEQLKSDLSSHKAVDLGLGASMTTRAEVGVRDTIARHECPDFRIEGLTIVMHMRGQDDLVINTDLKQET
jgi:hypothetical protein